MGARPQCVKTCSDHSNPHKNECLDAEREASKARLPEADRQTKLWYIYIMFLKFAEWVPSEVRLP